MRHASLPARVLGVAATDPPSLESTTQCHLTSKFGISIAVPLLCQVWSPNRQNGMARLLESARRAASVLGEPTRAPSLVWWMALWTNPENLCPAAFGHLVSRGVAVMPLV
jgi:hypothetical protein